jgi:hypothetical protein
MLNVKIVRGKFDCPSRLSSGQRLSAHKPSQIIMICQDFQLDLQAFDVVSPVYYRRNNCE